MLIFWYFIPLRIFDLDGFRLPYRTHWRLWKGGVDDGGDFDIVIASPEKVRGNGRSEADAREDLNYRLEE